MKKDSDLDVFLKRFEKVCRQFQLLPAEWAKYRTPGLRGKALEVFAALTTTMDQDYEAIKNALIQRFNITPEVYRKQFRTLQRTGTDNYSDLAVGLRNHFRQWTQGWGVTTLEALDLMLLDQFLHTCSMEVRLFILEQEPRTLDKAAQFADVCAASRVPEARKPAVPGWKGAKPPVNTFTGTRISRGVTPAQVPRPAVDNRRCFVCNQVGHISTACTEKRKTTPLPKPSISSPAVLFVGGKQRASFDNLQAVTVGNTVTMGQRDTGAEMTLVHPELVNSEDLIPGRTLTVAGVGGLTPALPMARVYLDWGAGIGMMEVGVTDKIPTNVLLGTDLGCLVSRYIPSDIEEDAGECATPSEVAPVAYGDIETVPTTCDNSVFTYVLELHNDTVPSDNLNIVTNALVEVCITNNNVEGDTCPSKDNGLCSGLVAGNVIEMHEVPITSTSTLLHREGENCVSISSVTSSQGAQETNSGLGFGPPTVLAKKRSELAVHSQGLVLVRMWCSPPAQTQTVACFRPPYTLMTVCRSCGRWLVRPLRGKTKKS
ncbi:uncharacterized protein LOC120990950 [Bufo bufo]|uniref:uncharacterized protein LOC120990950 n=1 Tax=Bufo bufo TaxID=8384 RepID=UPI001ABDF9C3|nr:uncharacterized protein LOC120990950 [Bufo bufo]